MDLLQHNHTAYLSVVDHLKTSDRTMVIHPTGTGKSVIALQLIEDNPDARILYVTSVATNLLEFWDKVDKLGGRRMVLNLSNIPRYIGTGVKGDLDGVPADDDDLEETITDEERDEMLKKATEVDESFLEGPLVQFCLYAGLENLLPDFDFIFLDEFHRAGAPMWERKVLKLLDDNNAAKVIGFSATPDRNDGKDMRKLFFGDVASEMKLSEAIIDGLLPLPKYWLGRVEIGALVEDDDPTKTVSTVTADKPPRLIVAKRHLEAGTGLREAFKEALETEDGVHGKYIVFCRNILNTRQIRRLSQEWFDWAGEVHMYEMHSQNRDGYADFINDDTDSLRLLFVVDMLTEGVHMDDLDGVFMIRPTESERIYFQQLGRALAVTTRRQHPIIFDIVSNAAVMKGGLKFWEGVGREMDMEEEELNKFFHVTAEAADFLDYLEETEYDYYAAMKSFYEKNGHLYIPPDYKVDGHDIYKEFSRIRSRGKQLLPELKKRYDEIGMDWEITYKWMKGFWAAQAYFEEYGNLNVPSTIREYHDTWLYDWVKKNREIKDKLVERQIIMLDSLGMDWEVKDPWEEMYQELLLYRKEHGHTDVPGDYGKLGKWVKIQRANIPEGERKERLDAIGFEWDGRQSRSRNAWRQGVSNCVEFWKAHGNIKVPAGYVTEEGYKLGNFVKKAKKDGRFEELEKECVDRARG